MVPVDIGDTVEALEGKLLEQLGTNGEGEGEGDGKGKGKGKGKGDKVKVMETLAITGTTHFSKILL